jgi:hypothetical protein
MAMFADFAGVESLLAELPDEAGAEEVLPYLESLDFAAYGGTDDGERTTIVFAVGVD